MDYYADMNFDDLKEAAELMGFDVISEAAMMGATPPDIPNSDPYFNECVSIAFLNAVFNMAGEIDPTESRWNSFPPLVKKVYRDLTLMEGKDYRWNTR